MTSKDFAPVQQRLMEFIRKQFHPGFNHYNVSKLIGDASSRQYFRYRTDSDQSYILAAYPEPFELEDFPYLQIYQLFSELGIPVPQIVEIDGPLGIVMQEDLGDVTLQKRFLEVGRQRKGYLKQAIDYILLIQEQGSRRLPSHYEASRLCFDFEKLRWELKFFQSYYLRDYRGLDPTEIDLGREFDLLASELAAGLRLLCHRDFHVRNLMLKDETLYVIDFQDARWGPVTYDLVSLLKDSIELEMEEMDELVGYYLDHSSPVLSRLEYQRQFHLMSVQRLLKALGTYGYQVKIRENFIYEQYMAGSLHRAQMSLEWLKEFPAIRSLVERELEGAASSSVVSGQR